MYSRRKFKSEYICYICLLDIIHHPSDKPVIVAGAVGEEGLKASDVEDQP